MDTAALDRKNSEAFRLVKKVALPLGEGLAEENTAFTGEGVKSITDANF